MDDALHYAKIIEDKLENFRNVCGAAKIHGVLSELGSVRTRIHLYNGSDEERKKLNDAVGHAEQFLYKSASTLDKTKSLC